MQHSVSKFFPLLFALVAIVGMAMGAKLHSSLRGDGLWVDARQSDTDDKSIDDALGYIRERYYGDLDTDQFSQKVIRAMMGELDDYSGYMDRRSDQSYTRYINGTFLGRGFDLYSGDRHVVTRVIAGSPAARAGVKRGDVLQRIEDSPTEGLSRDSISSLLDLSDTVSVEMLRGDEILSLDIVEGEVEIPIVRSKRIDDTDVTYLRINRFSHGVFGEIMDVLDTYKKGGYRVQDLIIDLRDNPGGVVDEVVKLLNQIVAEPKVKLLSTINSKGRKNDYESNGRVFFDIGKVICLINRNSASASEIMAGALQDLDRAVIVGEASYGKGFVQQNFKLSNGSSINLTVGEYLLPSGRSIRPQSDSLEFMTLRSGRTLSTTQGVRPDILIDDECIVTPRFVDAHVMPMLVDQELIDDPILTIDQVRVLTQEFIDRYAPTVDRSCREDAQRQVAALVTELFYSDIGNVSQEFIDRDVKLALDIILSDRYDTILQLH